MTKTVVVGLSGGVDSAVSALLLQKQGFSVIALFMKNWKDLDGSCPADQDYQDVIAICHHLNIPYYSINFTQEYESLVFQPFLQACKEGKTPNPDVLCNEKIKFSLFFAKAKTLGADYVATGHYCRIGPKNTLCKGIDPQKDQSYFLYRISPKVLPHVLFPLGEFTKTTIRQIAEKEKLPVAKKKDSTGICFIGKRNFSSFLSSYLGFQEGEMKTLSGQVVGKHTGLAYYTIGQRKGLGLGGEGEPWFVVEKDLSSQTLFVERGADHPALYSKKLWTEPAHFLTKVSLPFSCTAKIRYRSQEACCKVSGEAHRLCVEFIEPQWGVTPGQSIVFYQDQVCLGGAIIQEREKAF